jgi:predicted nucleotidyltransferase
VSRVPTQDHPIGAGDTPHVRRLIRVARALGPLVDDVVFIGGAIAPLLQTELLLDHVRPTQDVDAIIATTHYGTIESLQNRLRASGFTPEHLHGHVHRYVLSTADALPIPFDLVPAGSHLGASGNVWDLLAIETAVETRLDEDIVIRHAAAPAFLALKWSAHEDRGGDDPFASHDLEDILGVIACRATIVHEIENAPARIREYLAQRASELLAHADLMEIIQDAVRGPGSLVMLVRDRLEAVAAAPS